MRHQTFFAVLLAIILSKCNIAGDCSNHLSSQISNAKGNFKIVKFDRGCGATTDNNIQLSVIKFSDSLPNESGNIFISESKVGANLDLDTSVQAHWVNDTTIIVTHDRDLGIFKKNTQVKKLTVIYQLK